MLMAEVVPININLLYFHLKLKVWFLYITFSDLLTTCRQQTECKYKYLRRDPDHQVRTGFVL